MSQHYSNPRRENDPHALPDIEVFELTAAEVAAMDDDMVHDYMKRHEFRLAAMNSKAQNAMLAAMVQEEGITGGWFWQACFPGCLPDGPPMGPFETRAEAIADAQSGAEDEEDATPTGYLPGIVATEPCPNCGRLSPVYRREDAPEFREIVCDGCAGCWEMGEEDETE
jgi:hypothetical protein